MPPRHALDVLIAFRMDVTKLRYENWDEVIHYCRYSAMPVGRFMLDVHGESTSTWAGVRCAVRGLQINNHLQDCAQGLSKTSTASICRAMRWPPAAPPSSMLGEAKSPPRCCNACRRSRVRHRNAARREQVARAADHGFPPRRSRSSVIQAFADKIVAHAEGARSAERARASEQARTARASAWLASPAKSAAARSGTRGHLPRPAAGA